MLGNTFTPDVNTEATLRGTYNGNWTAGNLEPGAFAGAFSSPFVGIKHTLDVAASAVAEAATPILEEVTPDAMSGWLRDQRRTAYQSMATTRADPTTMGIVGQVGHAFGSVMTMGAMGAVAAPYTGLSSLGLAAYSIGGLTGYDKYTELKDQGVDPASAFKAAALTGSVMGIGAALPPFIGGTLTKQIASGMGLNVGLGMGERAGTAAILGEKYPEIAKHYETLDKSAILIDAVLGAAFPLGARMLPKGTTVAELDTAMQANRGVAEQTRDPALQTTVQGIDAKLAADQEVTRQIMEEGRLPGEITVPPGVMDNVAPNPAVGREAALVARAIDDMMMQENGVSLRDMENDITVLADAFRGSRDAVQVRGAEEVDVRQQARDGEAVGEGGVETLSKEATDTLEKASVMYDDGRGERAMSAKQAADHMTKQMKLYQDFIKCIGG
jgi:hypothetical protein